MKRHDIIATPLYKKALESYGVGTLKTENGQAVASPQEAKQEAGRLTGQSYNGLPYIEKQKLRKTAGRFGNTKKQEIQESQRSSGPW
jgi:hypothetical protein